ncbi:hypothetical protein DRE_04350 [Drechslerella stenobrocha 248]|uniref:Isoaspartyl peptidase n=1 Tax=Drechslerella stenobrocha 248 TaxID=1043628 RepID=W7I1L5_9PEZI|nr:hypothetical protein DRE_04350 [Drechslerella stenobrocha 248]
MSRVTTSQAAGARIVIHGGAGNISRQNLSPESRHEYLSAIARILQKIHPQLASGRLHALDAAVDAVRMLEDDPLFNAGKGAVFTVDGTNELEASVMVSRGQHKRCAGVFLLKHVKNPVLLAKEVLLRDDPTVERAERHTCLSGPYLEKLAGEWGLDIVDPSYFFTDKRWQQHLRDLKRRPSGNSVSRSCDEGDDMKEKEKDDLVESPTSDDTLEEYLPKGTVGCVVLDNSGLIAAATSTGGLTNKVPGRIGDTPTPGAGFWAEEWDISDSATSRPVIGSAAELLKQKIAACLPVLAPRPTKTRRAVGLSGTGNGDYFLRLSACHNIVSRCRFGGKSLQAAAAEVCGPGGEMEEAADGRGDADGAVIGVDEDGEVVMEMNCGGCFRGTVDGAGRVLVAAYADEDLAEWTNSP